MKGYKKFLQINCIVHQDKSKHYTASCDWPWFSTHYLGEWHHKPSIMTFKTSTKWYKDFNQCKKDLRKCFLNWIKEIKLSKAKKIKRVFKIWP